MVLYTDIWCCTLKYCAVTELLCCKLKYCAVHWTMVLYTELLCITLNYCAVHWTMVLYTELWCCTLNYCAVLWTMVLYSVFVLVYFPLLCFTTLHSMHNTVQPGVCSHQWYGHTVTLHTAHHIALLYTALHCKLNCTVIHCTLNTYNTMHTQHLQCTAHHCTAHCTALYTELHRTALHISYLTLLCGVWTYHTSYPTTVTQGTISGGITATSPYHKYLHHRSSPNTDITPPIINKHQHQHPN